MTASGSWTTTKGMNPNQTVNTGPKSLPISWSISWEKISSESYANIYSHLFIKTYIKEFDNILLSLLSHRTLAVKFTVIKKLTKQCHSILTLKFGVE